MNPQALLIDDEPDILELLSMTLNTMSIDTYTAETLEQAEQAIKQQNFDFCLTDMRLPDGNGLDFVNSVRKSKPDLPIAVITAHGNMDLAVQALKSGAFDFVSKPIKLRVLRDLVNTALKLSNYSQPNAKKERRSRDRLLGETDVIKSLRGKIAKLAKSQAPVYISGESGTGKELAARLIHELGVRSEHAFVPINCGAIPADLVESELFGHKKGAFTGAMSDKEGLFKAADGGTLFLDEVADLPLMMQVKLLRAIQEKSIRPVGGHEELNVDVRILCATHKNLAESVKKGTFREDLFYRLNVIELQLPSLRQRVDDIPLLAESIMVKLARQNKVETPLLSDCAKQGLQSYSFPGNVRELENILERALTWCEGNEIKHDDLLLPERVKSEDSLIQTQHKQEDYVRPSEQQTFTEHDLEAQLIEQERVLISQALESTRWNKTAAAKKLGITFRALRYKLKKLGLE
jgi:two-component system response regulator PilR (NtrC family)